MKDLIKVNYLNGVYRNEVNNDAFLFIECVQEEQKKVNESFFKIGMCLYEAQKEHYPEMLGYKNLGELSENVFGIKKSTCYKFINIYEQTKSDTPFLMLPKYEKYTGSKLDIVLSVKDERDEFLKIINPNLTYRNLISAKAKFENAISRPHEYVDDVLCVNGNYVQNFEDLMNLPEAQEPAEEEFHQEKLEEVKIDEIQLEEKDRELFLVLFKDFLEKNNIVCFKAKPERAKSTSKKIVSLFDYYLR